MQIERYQSSDEIPPVSKKGREELSQPAQKISRSQHEKKHPSSNACRRCMLERFDIGQRGQRSMEGDRSTTPWRTKQRFKRSAEVAGPETEGEAVFEYGKPVSSGTPQVQRPRRSAQGDASSTQASGDLSLRPRTEPDATFGTHRKGPSHRANSMVRASRVPWTFSSLAKTESPPNSDNVFCTIASGLTIQSHWDNTRHFYADASRT